eukprot:CAMPEP_0113661852 /NCGR_PEP_ID=MMETSP0038_2-20120614/221_1 /TAXON_ID=2898 /ORGANISM="Cryptomonas paramecium" /LENGTH=143 /DNA_ID=CAMNT_0000576623 /DNA_START=49 /DNA_END=480 /DNA_ORIENTATION=+ /assembly_acc=CAM_ASM_000170
MTISARVHESAVVPAPVSTVWKKIRAMDFKWWSLVAATSCESSVDQVGSIHVISYKDGSKWTVKLSELSDTDTFLTYELVSSEEPLQVTSAIHTIRLRRITADNTTLVEWTSDYSADVTSAVTEDSRHKKLEAFADLSKSVKA